MKISKKELKQIITEEFEKKLFRTEQSKTMSILTEAEMTPEIREILYKALNKMWNAQKKWILQTIIRSRNEMAVINARQNREINAVEKEIETLKQAISDIARENSR